MEKRVGGSGRRRRSGRPSSSSPAVSEGRAGYCLFFCLRGRKKKTLPANAVTNVAPSAEANKNISSSSGRAAADRTECITFGGWWQWLAGIIQRVSAAVRWKHTLAARPLSSSFVKTCQPPSLTNADDSHGRMTHSFFVFFCLPNDKQRFQRKSNQSPRTQQRSRSIPALQSTAFCH